jgi:PhzF family phenazine biosynthesis protein
LKLLRVDAFTARPFGGNPAAVVLDAVGLRDEQMRSIAAEMNLSETCFLLPSQGDADFRLRWFTPRTEVSFCGHGTVATAHALFAAGRFGGGRFVPGGLVFETLGGPLRVERFEDVYYLTPGPREIQPFHGSLEPLLEALNLRAEDIADWAPPAVSPEHALMLFVRTLDALRRARSSAELGALGERQGIRAFCLTTRETLEPASRLHSRYFAPAKGVAEDPVTGSVHASLAVHLHRLGVVPERFVAEQGDLMGRPGRLYLETGSDGPRVGGRATSVFSGEILV